MAQELVVKEPFTQQMQISGEKMTRLLDESGLDITASFWWYATEFGEWRLMLASPKVDSKGPRAVYSAIQSVIFAHREELPGLGLENIGVLSPKHTIIRLLGALVRTQSGTSGIRVTRNYINNIFIEDAYVYRLRPPRRRRPLTTRRR